MYWLIEMANANFQISVTQSEFTQVWIKSRFSRAHLIGWRQKLSNITNIAVSQIFGA